MTAPIPRCQPEGAHAPTPWRIFTNPDGTKLVGIGAEDGQGILDAGFGVWSWNDAEGIANAELVVEAVNTYAIATRALENYDALVNALEQIANEVFTDGTPTKAARIALAALALSRPNHSAPNHSAPEK